jgi:site-specific DNA-cytosine methylase
VTKVPRWHLASLRRETHGASLHGQTVTERTFTVLCPFGGSGAGALGFKRARARLFKATARFEVLGGIDIDPNASKDFLYLTGAPSLTADIATMEPRGLVRAFGRTAPDVVFCSPPCKGASGLLSERKAKTKKYEELNQLAVIWTRLMLQAWEAPPKLVLLENVPRLQSRAHAMLEEVKRLLRAAGYVLHEGFHDCGELGGLAQHRKRYLLVARHAKRVPPLLYQPPKKRVRACGEVLGALPMPGDPVAGPMHRLPKISWLNWVRLALIPAGGDWRDLPGVLIDGQKRREKFKRHAVEGWDEPVGTIGGSGSNGVENIADPRIPLPACKPSSHHNKYRVEDWEKPAHTVIGATRPGSGAPSVADPRLATLPEPLDGMQLERPAYDHAYRVLRMGEPSFVVHGKSHPGNGAYSVADPRIDCEPFAGAYNVLSWEEAAATITGHDAKMDNGLFSVADPRRPPSFTPLIVAADGTWHRPFTTLELAALQGFPVVVDGKPLVLSGTVSQQREHIGNAVPVATAEAIAEQMLVTLLQADLGSFKLSAGQVWVEPVEGDA